MSLKDKNKIVQILNHIKHFLELDKEYKNVFKSTDCD